MKKKIILILIIYFHLGCKNYPTIEEFTEENIVVTSITKERGSMILNNEIWMHSTFWEKQVTSMDDYERLWLFHKLKVGDTIWVSKDINEVHVKNEDGLRIFKHSNIDSFN